MRIERARLRHIGYGVFERVAGEQQAQFLDMEKRGIVAVDIGVAQIHVQSPHLELQMVLIDGLGQKKGRDSRRPVIDAGLDRGAVALEML